MNGSNQEPSGYAELAPLLTFDEARTLDGDTIQLGIPEQQLMGQAAAATVNRLITSGWLELSGNIHILCGTGNNGGDGYAIAWMLCGFGAASRVQVYASGSPKSQAAAFYRSLCAERLSILSIEDFRSAGRSDLILECLLGSGQRGAVRAPFDLAAHEIIQAQKRGAKLISIDVPVGLVEESRVDFAQLPLPDEIHCYGPVKLAVALHPLLATRAFSLPIGFLPRRGSAALWEGPPISFRRADTDHKYSAGSALIIGGQNGMEGAAILASDCFFAAGGGICELLTPDSEARTRILAARPSLMVRGLSEGAQIKAAAVLIGPGLRLTDPFADQILSVLSGFQEGTKVILDASSCALALDPRYPASLKKTTILTPHGGEWSRIGGSVPDCVESFKRAALFARQIGVKVLVKGSVSVLFEETSVVYARPNGSLAVAGSGDCLGGVILAALARPAGYSPARSVCSAMDLMHHALRGKTNPQASEFAELIRSAAAA